jgi:hypothetical protein
MKKAAAGNASAAPGNDSGNDGHYDVYWPRSPRQAGVAPLAPRLDSLDGKTIGFVWDYMFRGDEIFGLLEQGIRARFPAARFVNWREFGNTHGSEEHAVLCALPRRLEELGVDAAISGMGC